MTPDQLKNAGESLFGTQWQTPLARTLGMRDASEVRKWISGKRPVPQRTAERIANLLKQDEWIVGRGANTYIDYIVHTHHPRFIARIADPEVDEDANVLSGVVFACENGEYICEMIWLDRIPVHDELVELMNRANKALDLAAINEV